VDIVWVGGPPKGAVNIVDTVGVTGGQTTKGAVNIVDTVGVTGWADH